jgi:hypothetical protein
MRDDFTQKTKEVMAHRVGYRCSKPDCGILTRGAASDDEGTINVGFAAHITAASPDGPRYDPNLTSDQRKHHSNGIWLSGLTRSWLIPMRRILQLKSWFPGRE